MEPFFYTSFLPKIDRFTDDKLNTIKNNNFWIITNNYKEYKKIIKKNSCLKKYNSFPEKLITINKNWQQQRFNWYIVFCKK